MFDRLSGGEGKIFLLVSLSRIFEEVLRGTFFSSFGWMFQGLVNGFFLGGERCLRERGCSCFVSFESLLNIEYK